jgi:uncharacterized cupin superfamily protein
MPSTMIECKGKVCWTALSANGLHHFGVRFVDLSPGERSIIADFTSKGLALSVAI